MPIEDRKVVTFHYTLKNEAGEEIESSREREPVVYLHGYRNIVPGLESAMKGREVGDTFEVTVPPAEAYGEYNLDVRRHHVPVLQVGKTDSCALW